MTEQEIHSICKKYEIKDYTINMDGSIDVHNSVYLNGRNLTEIPLQFNYVWGNFNCSNNRLTSLKGCPKRLLGQYFQCQWNLLSNLEYFPIVEDYTRSSVGMNPLKSISGFNGNINLLFCENKDKLVRKYLRSKKLKIINQL